MKAANWKTRQSPRGVQSNRSRARFVETLEQRHMLSGDSVVGLSVAEVNERIDSLKSYFDSVMVSAHETFLDLSIQSGTNGWSLYNLQLGVDGVLSMYEATGDRAVLDQAIEYITNVMDAAEVIEGSFRESDGYLDWELLSGGGPRPRREGAYLYDIQIGSAMSRLARVLHEDARLQEDEHLASFGDQLVHFVDEQIVDKWLRARFLRDWLEGFQDRNGYWADVATHTVTVCHDLTQVLGDQSSCNGVHSVLAAQFRDSLVVQSDESYLWELWSTYPPNHQHPSPDTSHENRVATMMSRLAADNFVFDRSDVYHLAKTFTQRIWNGRTDWDASPGIEGSPWFHNYIDGNDGAYRNSLHFEYGTPGMNGFVYDGWIRLGEFDPEVQVAGEALLSFIQENRSNVNAIRQRNGSVFGKVALAGHLARNLRFAEYFHHDNATSAEPSGAGAVPGDISGDANRDGSVTFADFLILSRNFGQTLVTWNDGDFDGDTIVGFSDFLVLASHFQSSQSAGT